MQSARIIGGAGTGKTTELIRLMEATLATKVKDPMRIGFVSFTRAARREAASRAADRFGITLDELERSGWFRTIHSVCHRVLGVGDELLTDNASSRTWISEAVGEEIRTGATNAGDLSEVFEVSTQAGKCLSIWDVARSMLVPVLDLWERQSTIDPNGTPDLDEIRRIVDRYEREKAHDGRCDFTDLLLRVAGKRHLFDHLATVEPEGYQPNLPVWFFDEQQDTSALSDLVCRRLVLGAQWVYVVGDPFQAIYGWAGADPQCFLDWPIEDGKQRILDQSFRCPSRILATGERILTRCSNYFDRRIKPVSEGGIVSEESFLGGWESEIDPRASWMILARTNRMAYRASQVLDESGVPWGPTQTHGNKSLRKAAAVGALHTLASGGEIQGRDWYSIVKILPTKYAGVNLLERGTKTRFSDEEDCEKINQLGLSELQEYGATKILVDAIKHDHWRSIVPDCEALVAACVKWGPEVLIAPRVRVGTIHSAKGLEADNVAVLTSITQPILRGMDDTKGSDEEARIWYVAATRAKERLLWLHDYRDRMRYEVN